MAIIPIAETKPSLRALENMCHSELGGGSCWLNAALRALWAPPPFKDALCTLWQAMPRDTREMMFDACVRRRAPTWRFGPGYQSRPLLSMRRRAFPQREELFAAVIFAVAHLKPWTAACYPYLPTDHFFDGAQDDATEFLAHFLLAADVSPTLHAVAAGSMWQTLRCPRCTATCSRQLNTFDVLPIPAVYSDHLPHATIQEALDAHLQPETIDFAGACPACFHRFQRASRTFAVEVAPAVLYVTMNRWLQPGQPCADNVLDPSLSLEFVGKVWRCTSFVLHIGESAATGH